ncbi:MAG: hypothetical protein AAF242_15635 [Bacteroidota bacterium]
MHFKTSLILFSFILLVTSCTVNDQQGEAVTRDQLIQELLKQDDLPKWTPAGKVLIIRDDFCETFDCDEFFADYPDQVQLFTREELFLRATNKYLSIQEVDLQNAYLRVHHVMGKNKKVVEVSL